MIAFGGKIKSFLVSAKTTVKQLIFNTNQRNPVLRHKGERPLNSLLGSGESKHRHLSDKRRWEETARRGRCLRGRLAIPRQNETQPETLLISTIDRDKSRRVSKSLESPSTKV